MEHDPDAVALIEAHLEEMVSGPEGAELVEDRLRLRVGEVRARLVRREPLLRRVRGGTGVALPEPGRYSSFASKVVSSPMVSLL